MISSVNDLMSDTYQGRKKKEERRKKKQDSRKEA
jgi:hypothetical protein